MSGSIRIMDMPDLGAVSDAVSLVAEHAGSGRVAAPAVRDYMGLTFATQAALTTETNARIAGDGGMVPLTGGAITNPGTFDATGMHDTLSVMVHGASSLTEFQWSHPGNTSTEAFAAGIIVPPTTTAYSANAIGAYVQNGSTIAAGATGIYSYVRNTIAGASSYALNLLATDQTNVSNGGVSSTVVGAEIDMGAFNVATHAIGLNLIGVFPNGTPALAVAYQVSALDPAPFQVGLNIGDRSAATAISIGTAQLTANSDGQPINLAARDASNVLHVAAIQATHRTDGTAGADITLSTPSGGVQAPGYLKVGGVFAATGVANFGAGQVVVASGANLVGFNAGATPVGSITTNGTTTAYNTSSDYRLKDTYGPADTGALIDAIPAYDAAFKGSEQHQPMLLAHEIAEGGAPWAVNGEKDAVDDAGAIRPQQVDYLSLIPAIWAELRALRLRVAALEAP